MRRGVQGRRRRAARANPGRRGAIVAPCYSVTHADLGRTKNKAFGLYAGRVALDSMYAAPTTSISELPGIHDRAKHERGGAPYFVSAQNPL